VKSRFPQAQFVFVGPSDNGVHGIDANTLRAWADAVSYEGATDTPHEALARAHVVVLPSLVEGMSRTLMEAAAVGRPLITSDIPGCRAAVDERINGCLVPPHDARALAEAMQSFLERPDQLPAMARASRLKAERRFDEREIVQHEVAIILGHASSSVGVA
jgi:glycosyltransferase involved in cell wall biosynthesis